MQTDMTDPFKDWRDVIEEGIRHSRSFCLALFTGGGDLLDAADPATPVFSGFITLRTDETDTTGASDTSILATV